MAYQKVLVTGAAGFIGFHCAKRLLDEGVQVIGVDNINNYYTPTLKSDRLRQLEQYETFSFHQIDVASYGSLEKVFRSEQPEAVIHLAAQAGVRYSLQNPHVYGTSNLVGMLNILECCRHGEVQHLVYASSSSVYGSNTKLPFAVEDRVDNPISLYAATKKANELMAHSYSHLFDLPTTGLRFFTVYGPWGRPDMAMWIFVQKILAGEPIQLYNDGQMRRDFTYVDDIVEGVVRVLNRWNRQSEDKYNIFNIGNHSPVELLHLVRTLEQLTGQKAKITLGPLQPGDVEATYSDVTSLTAAVGFQPKTSIELGAELFVRWYREYHKTER